MVYNTVAGIVSMVFRRVYRIYSKFSATKYGERTRVNVLRFTLIRRSVFARVWNVIYTGREKIAYEIWKKATYKLHYAYRSS